MNSIYSKLILLGLIIINTQIATAHYPTEQGGEVFTIDTPASQYSKSLDDEEGEDYYRNPYYVMNAMISANCKQQGLVTYNKYISINFADFVICTEMISEDFKFIFKAYRPKDSSSTPSPQYKIILTILETIKDRYKSITGHDPTKLNDLTKLNDRN